MKLKHWPSSTLVFAAAILASTPLVHAGGMDDHPMHAGHQHAHDAAPAVAHDHSRHLAPPPAAALPESAPVKLSESAPVKLSAKPLNDQDGRSRQLQKDLIGERIAVVTFVYTNCTTVCPASSAIMAELQNKLGSRLDKEVRLISLSVDPANDTPERLKHYAAQYDAKPGWFWLTGTAANVSEALKGFGAYTANFENHPVIMMIGDGKTGRWSRHYGLSNADNLLAQVDKYLAARQVDSQLARR